MRELNEQEIEMFDIDPSLNEIEHDGITYKRGDLVRMIEDDEMHGLLEGDEGEILGFFKVAPAKDPALAIALGGSVTGYTGLVFEPEGMEPMSCKPEQVEKVLSRSSR